MKIAVINPSMKLAGGVERVVALQVNAWIEYYNYEVVIITQDDFVCESFYKLNSNVRIVTVGKLVRYNILDDIRGVRKYRKRSQRKKQYKEIIEKENPDIVVSTMQGEENFFLKSVSNNIPVIGVNHLTIYWRKGYCEKSLKSKYDAYRIYLDHLKNWRKYDKIVALSLTDKFNLMKEKCSVTYIPNPCSFDVVINSNTNRKKQIVMVGRLDYLKGQDRLLDIWARISTKYPDWELLLIGDGEYRNILLEKENQLNISKSVKHIYKTNNVQKYLLESSIFAFTSRLESFGMVILEAFSCGLPTICYDCENGPRDLVKDEVNGFLIEDNNIESFVEKLSILIENKTLVNKMREEAINTTANYSLNIVMSQWDTLINEIARHSDGKY